MNGIQVDRSGFAVCPLHGDRDASLKVYGGTRGWVCYGCHKGGDVINLAMDLYGLSFRDAIARLNDDFGVGIDMNRKPTSRESFLAAVKLSRNREKARQDEQKKAALERAYWKAFDEWRGYDVILMDLEDKQKGPDGFTPDFAAALRGRTEAYEKLKILEERRLNYGRS
jgi:DNA primase